VKIAKPKKISAAKAKDKAWKVFSQYIRRKYADFLGYASCVTCGIRKHYKDLHAGHFIDGRNNTVLYDERLVHPQCFHCNSKHPGCLSGNKVAYTVFMMKTYGYTVEEIKRFQDMYYSSKPMKAWEHDEIRIKYEQKLKELAN
jgi:hypothetical protein